MADFAGIGTVWLDLPGGRKLEVKEELTYGEDKVLQGYAAKGLTAEGDAYGPDYERWFVKRLATWIVGWSLTDKAGMPVPVTDSAIRGLKPVVAGQIDAALSRHIEDSLKNALTAEGTAT